MKKSDLANVNIIYNCQRLVTNPLNINSTLVSSKNYFHSGTIAVLKADRSSRKLSSILLVHAESPVTAIRRYDADELSTNYQVRNQKN